MRGTHLHSPIRETTEWIIPADAGNTFKDRSVDEATRDHPRGCGEHMAKRNAIGTCSGSSPRMRGTRTEVGVTDGFVGIIPADAGNTQ